MLLRILAFEFRYQLRQPLFWIAFALFFLLTFGAITTDAVTLGGSIGSVNRNAPFVILQMMAVMTAIGTFLTTAFVANSIHRDYECRTDGLFFSLPLKKRDYLLGRFAGSLLLAIAVFASVMLGVWVGSLMPWLEPSRVGPTMAGPYIEAMLIFVVPNLFMSGALFFSLATVTRSMLWTYVGVVVFFVGYGIASVFAAGLENQMVAALADPYGIGAFELVTRYWTVSEKNTASLPFTGALVWNRLLYGGVGVAALAFTYGWFRFSAAGTGSARRRRRGEQGEEAEAAREPRAAEAV
ncbi:MAG TPA: ABC transporter permease subunit, partial [Candidatus Polarisedimenticolia bacterium]|nr:ABC transporter permease subunit [Candidatus Polarisedimenticolia bacterium]